MPAKDDVDYEEDNDDDKTRLLLVGWLVDSGVVGGSRAGPVVTPHTLELTPRGRVFLQLAPPETARAYLPPEYRPGRVYSDTESEKEKLQSY
ncbi:hypothetical protein M0802_014603 [Mischocyttarus mexicanus]|nr:hypothetical protein M0802_014603 [Mischocyttarus mexicanus]